MAEITTTEARADTLRYWVGLPLENAFDDLDCNRVERVFERGLNQASFDVTMVEARAEYVLLVVEGAGVRVPAQEITDRLNTLVASYNKSWPARETNDATELEVRRTRRVGTLGRNGVEADLDDARELLRDLGAIAPEDVTAGDAEASEATAGGDDE